MSRKAKTIFAFIVLFIWATSFLADIVITKYEPPVALHPVMMLVAGYVMRATRLKVAENPNPTGEVEKILKEEETNSTTKKEEQ